MAEGEKEWTYELVTESGTFNNANDVEGEGKATITFNAGENEGKTETYEGEYAMKKRSGFGKYTYFNGDVFKGNWNEGAKYKYGELYYNTPAAAEGEEEGAGPKRGGKYLGNYGSTESAGDQSYSIGGADNVRNGAGTFVYVNGDQYSGDWAKGKKSGQGTYFFKADRTRLVGTWKDGKIVTGKWIFPNGTYYVGKFENGKPNGVGNWVFKSGHQLAGSYTQTKIGEEAAEVAEGEEPPPVEVEATWMSSSIVSVAG
jgi:hypothetical protein